MALQSTCPLMHWVMASKVITHNAYMSALRPMHTECSTAHSRRRTLHRLTSWCTKKIIWKHDSGCVQDSSNSMTVMMQAAHCVCVPLCWKRFNWMHALYSVRVAGCSCSSVYGAVTIWARGAARQRCICWSRAAAARCQHPYQPTYVHTHPPSPGPTYLPSYLTACLTTPMHRTYCMGR